MYIANRATIRAYRDSLDKRIVAIVVVLLIAFGAYVGIMSFHPQQSASTSLTSSISTSSLTSSQSSSVLTHSTSVSTSASSSSSASTQSTSTTTQTETTSTSSTTSITTRKPAEDFLALQANGTEGAIKVSPSPEQGGGYAPGTIIRLTPVPNGGYYFFRWSGQASGSENPLLLRLTENETVQADFLSSSMSSSLAPACAASVSPQSPTTTPASPSTAGPVSFQVVGQDGGPVQAVAVSGSYLYAGIGVRVVAFNVQDLIAPDETGSTAPLNGSVTGIAISGNLAAVSAGGGGLYLVDISNPSQPIVTGHYQSEGYAGGVAISGHYAYVADGPDGLVIVDISDLSSPTEVAGIFGLDYAFGVAVSGTVAYVAAGGSGVMVANVSNPTNPTALGSLGTSGYDFAVAVSGTTALVAGGWKGIQSLDVSSPASPKVVENITTTGWAMGVSVLGGLLNVAEGESGLQIYRLQGGTLSHLGGFQVSDSNFVAIAVDGHTAFVADGMHGLYIIDVSDPSHPVELSLYPSSFNVQGVVVNGGYAYAGSTNGVVRVINVTYPTNPLDLGEFTLPGPAGAMAASGDSLYVPVQALNLLFPLNVTDPLSPDAGLPISFAFYTPGGQFGGVTGGSPRGAVLLGDILYIADESGLVIFDVANPSRPCMLGHLLPSSALIDGNPTNYWFTLDVSNGLAAMTVYNGTATMGAVALVNVTNPRNPEIISQFVSSALTYETSQSVAFYGGVLYVMSNSYLYALNTSDASSPREISILPLPNSADNSFNAIRMMTTYQGKLLLLDGASLVAVDVSDPSKMSISGSLSLPFPPSWVSASGGYIYVADGQGGVYVVQMLDAFQPPTSSSIGQGGTTSLHQLYDGNLAAMTVNNHSFINTLVSWATDAWSTIVNATHFLAEEIIGLATSDSMAIGHLLGGEGTTLAATPPDPPSCTVTITGDSGAGSLRACVQSESQGGTITFSQTEFPSDYPATIFLKSQLTVESNVVINGTSFGVIINGSEMASGLTGMYLAGNHVTVQGLEVVGFPSNGIAASGSSDVIKDCVVSGNKDVGVNLGGPGDSVIGSFIGTNPEGTEAIGSQNEGVALGSLETVGGSSPSDRNIISGNIISDVVSNSAYGNTIEGNYIGLDATGSRILDPPSTAGVVLEVNSSGNAVVDNVITTQRIAVVLIDPGSQYDSVTGNLIGLDATGKTGLAQNIVIVAAPYDVIGGASPADRNVIYGFIQSTVPNVYVLGNFFGTDVSGTSALPGLDKSIWLLGASQDFIGGTGPGDGNVINTANGVQVTDGSSYDFILGNQMGTNAQGQVAQTVNYDLDIQGSSHIFVQGNLVSGGSEYGITLSTGGDYNVIRANDVTGNAGVGANVTGNGNRIYGNSFTSNGVNAHDYGQRNFWDNGVSGNFWSDYSGVNGGNGIGPTPYYVTPNGVDRYPLISPPSIPTT